MKQSFYLEITRKGPHLEVSLSKGEQTLTHYEESSVSPEELGKRCNEMMHLLNMVSRRGIIPTSVIEEVQQMGRVLYNEIFPLSIKSQILEAPPSDLILRIDNTLVHVPWELLFDGEYFLCEKFNIGRMVKTQQIVAKRGETKPSLPLRILIIADPRGDLKASYEEGKRIRDHLQMENLKVNLITSEVSKDFLKKRLFNYDLIHYAGHADYDLDNPNQSGWLLEDGKFTSLDIRKMSGSNPLPWIVFSNACQSGQTEEWRIDETGEEKIYGLANAFLLSGVQHYIGTFWKVLDEPSTNFALKFYDQLLEGASVGESMREARLALKETYGEGNILWASYLLYGDPGIQYFALQGDNKEKEELAGVGVATLPIQKRQEAIIQKNGLRTRSASGNNGFSLWNDNAKRQKHHDIIEKCFKKAPFAIVAGVILGVLLLFGAIFYKTLTNYKAFTTQKLINPNTPSLTTGYEKKDMRHIENLVKSGMASDDQMADYFQNLVKKYQKEGLVKQGEKDFWTSRPITLFFALRKIGETNVKTEADSELLLHKLIFFLGKDQGITILERENLDVLLKELDISSSPLADPEHKLDMGQIVAGNLFTTSSISHFEGRWQVNLRIIASETSIVKASLSEVWTESEDLDSLASKLAQKIIQEIERAFPLRGRIKQYLSNDKVILNIGNKQRVEKGMKFHVLKDKDVIGQDGKPVALETLRIASLEITEVRDDFCYAQILDHQEDLKPGMKVSR